MIYLKLKTSKNVNNNVVIRIPVQHTCGFLLLKIPIHQPNANNGKFR